ncbi:LysR substrate-binding domain-containing protein [Albidovulum sediminicola]|uniref:LysR substrate-binding domain-containing protein n=1 Tax=Albidovulum sediminicola TaxID=2984331 RepID=A0ABT2Z232_9RHOB|nr:LysR substrate-binding domain-containing protein [Defluviimonas sp. WL0075]MCV2865181.1 LysR substrate-binding domain-containing protein [Defluviimonas sp. WL0075]
MRKLWKLVSSSRNLVVFEAAARLGSFTRAADEMSTQQPSVSAAIKQLEEGLGVKLFHRGHRKVELTSAGHRLYSDVSRALGEIEASVLAVHRMGRDEHVTLNASSAFSYYWMMPKLPDLRARHPAIDLRLQNSDREPDLDAENIDLAVRLGDGDWPGCAAARIADEVIFPVVSPSFALGAGGIGTIADMAEQRLIHLEEPVRVRPTWAHWFAHHGVVRQDLDSGLRLNDYALVLQAAAAGEGFAFGWRHIVRNLIERKLLVGLEEWAWRTDNGIYLVWSTERPLSPHACLVRDWIISVSEYPNR